MKDLKLDLDEGILQQTINVERYQVNDKYTEIYEMYLTNKNLIYVHEKSNGLFSKSEDVVEKIPLDNIKVVNGKVQIFKVDDDDYGLGLQILFKNGTREHFLFEKKKELSIWYDSIINAIIGEDEPVEKINKNDNKIAYIIPETAATSNALFSGLKNVVSSAKGVINDIKNQVVEEFKETSNEKNEIEQEEIKEEKIIQKDNNTDNNDNEIKELKRKEEKYMYCSNCGEKISDKSKFCNFCGATVDKYKDEEKEIEKKSDEIKTEKVEEQTERKTVYEGKIVKCPNCGENLKSFTANCPTCGFEFRGSKSSSAVAELAKKLEMIETRREKKKAGSKILSSLNMGEPLTTTDEQKISLIRSFPIPNTKEDLYEFLILSKSNIEIDLYQNTQIQSARLAVSDAWKAKFEQAYHKAKLLFKDDERMQEIQKMYDETNQSIKNSKWRIWKILGGIYGIIFVIIIITLIIVAICGGFSNNSDSTTKDNSSNISEIKTEETKTDEKDESKDESKNNSNTLASFGDNIVANSNKYIKIKEVGYTMTGKYLTCIVTISNSSSTKAIEYPKFRVTAYDKSGKILGSEERVLSVLYPNQDMVDQGTLIEASEEPAKIEVTLLEPDEDDVVDVSSLEHPEYKEMKCQNLSVNSDKITGKVYNPNKYKIESVMITVVFRDSNNKIVSSESTFIDDIPSNERVPFDISLASDAKVTDKIEAFAYIW